MTVSFFAFLGSFSPFLPHKGKKTQAKGSGRGQLSFQFLASKRMPPQQGVGMEVSVKSTLEMFALAWGLGGRLIPFTCLGQAPRPNPAPLPCLAGPACSFQASCPTGGERSRSSKGGRDRRGQTGHPGPGQPGRAVGLQGLPQRAADLEPGDGCSFSRRH